MIIPPRDLKRWFGVSPRGTLHVGAHLAEELEDYREANFGRVIWVEAHRDFIPKISSKIKGSSDLVFQGAAWSETGVVRDFHLANNGQSSSLFDFAEHQIFHPEIHFTSESQVTTIRLDELIPASEMFDFVNLDIQGAELDALKGLSSRLGEVRWIYCEVNRRTLYKDIPLIGDLDFFLGEFGFRRVVVAWTPAHWGDALYVRAGSKAMFVVLTISGLVLTSLKKTNSSVVLRRLRKKTRRMKSRLLSALMRIK